MTTFLTDDDPELPPAPAWALDELMSILAAAAADAMFAPDEIDAIEAAKNSAIASLIAVLRREGFDVA